MNQTVRYIIFIATSVLIIMLWQIWFPPPHPVKDHATAAATAPGKAAKSATTPTPAPAAIAPGTPAAPTPAPVADAEPAPGPPIEVKTGLWTALFSPKGAGLESFNLAPKDPQRGQEPHAGREMAHAGPDQALPLAIDIPALAGFGPTATYVGAQAAGQQAVDFTRSHGPVTVVKRFTYDPEKYQLNLAVDVKGVPAGVSSLPVRFLYTAFEPPQVSGGMFSLKARPEPHASICLLSDARSVTSEAFTGGDPLRALTGTPQFAGIDEKYFVAAMSPGSDPAGSSCEIGNGPTPVDHQAVLQRTLAVINGTASTSVSLYIGPKEASLLAAFDHNLSKSINYGYGGFLNIICDGLLLTLKGFHWLVRNWGLAIILLTIVMKSLTLPLTHKQMLSMEEGKRLNPLVEKIKEKYAGDNTRIQMETMKLYKEHNYQPLAGCFPMVIQMPVWFALYSSLGVSFDLYKEPFIRGWIDDLTAHDPFYILPVTLTLTMVLNQKLTPQPPPANDQAAQMQKMMLFMPVVFGLIMMTLPAGLNLYSLTSTILGIAQSMYFRRRFGGGGGSPVTPKKEREGRETRQGDKQPASA